jgi:hypothetical protein
MVPIVRSVDQKNAYINVFVARRYSALVPLIEPIVRTLCCDYTIFLVDAKLRTDFQSFRAASLSIIIASERLTDREEQASWFKRTTHDICVSSEKVYVLLFSLFPDKYTTSYNEISVDMQVHCLRETIDEHFDIVQVVEKLILLRELEA